VVSGPSAAAIVAAFEVSGFPTFTRFEAGEIRAAGADPRHHGGAGPAGGAAPRERAGPPLRAPGRPARSPSAWSRRCGGRLPARPASRWERWPRPSPTASRTNGGQRVARDRGGALDVPAAAVEAAIHRCVLTPAGTRVGAAGPPPPGRAGPGRGGSGGPGRGRPARAPAACSSRPPARSRGAGGGRPAPSPARGGPAWRPRGLRGWEGPRQRVFCAGRGGRREGPRYVHLPGGCTFGSALMGAFAGECTEIPCRPAHLRVGRDPDAARGAGPARPPPR